MSEKIVILHGAWQGPWIWEPVAEKLKAQGVEVLVPDILRQASGDAPFAAAADHLVALLGEQDVTVVGHSMGALCAAEVAPRLLGLKRVIFVDGSLCAPGTSLWDMFAAPQQDWLSSRTKDGKIAPVPAEAFGIDSATDQGKWLTANLCAHDLAWFKATVSHDLSGIKGMYIHCTNHPSPITQASAERARAWGMELCELAADHLPMLTHKNQLAEMLRVANG